MTVLKEKYKNKVWVIIQYRLLFEIKLEFQPLMRTFFEHPHTNDSISHKDNNVYLTSCLHLSILKTGRPSLGVYSILTDHMCIPAGTCVILFGSTPNILAPPTTLGIQP